MKKLIKVFILTTLILSSVITQTSLVFAEGATTDKGLVVSPAYIFEDLDPGQTTTKEFRVTNHLGYAQTFIVESRQIGIDKDGNPFLTEGINVTPAILEKEGYLTFTPTEFYLESGEGIDITVTVTLPDTSPTGYYLELAVTPKESIITAAMVGGYEEVAIPVALNYVGDPSQILKRLAINSFRVENLNHDKWTLFMKSILKGEHDAEVFEYLPANFITHLVNTGNQHIIPTGQIFISKNLEFKDPITLDFNPGQTVVFVDGGKYFTNVWNDSFITISDDGSLSVDWNKLTHFRIGKYYAQLSVIWNNNNSKEFVTDTVEFYVIPIKLILIALSILIAIVFVLMGIIKVSKAQERAKLKRQKSVKENAKTDK